MPKEFSYTMKQGRQIFDDPTARQQFLVKKPNDYRGFESHHKPRQVKSNPQLGYYWGLLIIEITKQLKELGWTITMGRGDNAFERYYTKDDTHEWLKKHCAKLGEDGVFITLSEQDLELCSKYITNVLWVAEFWLKMDVVALAAKQPELRSDFLPPKQVGNKSG